MAKDTFSTKKDIFSVGKWNGDEYTEQDIDEMIANFERLSSEDANFKVPLKVDFFKDTKEKHHGGQPAVGWITKLSKEGKKLYAHIENIPKTIKELIDTKAYRQVSAEVTWNMKVGQERLRRVLTGVALLGVEIPGVSNLDEFSALYHKELEQDEELKSYITEEHIYGGEGSNNFGHAGRQGQVGCSSNYGGARYNGSIRTIATRLGHAGVGARVKNGGKVGTVVDKITHSVTGKPGYEVKWDKTGNIEALPATELEAAEFEPKEKKHTKEDDMQEEMAKLQEEKAKLEKQLQEQKDFVAKIEAEKKEATEAKRRAEIKTFVEAKKAEGKILPAHEAQVTQVLESLDDSKTVKFTNADNKEEEMSVRKVFENYLNALPRLVNFSQKSEEGQRTEEFVAKPEDEYGTVESQKLDFSVKKHMEKAKCSYKEALIAVSKELKNQ